MDIPPSTHPIWRNLITGTIKLNFEVVALKILHGALVRAYTRDPSPARLEKSASNLREFFIQNAGQPSTRKDLEKICG
jgi:hypothetical protein